MVFEDFALEPDAAVAPTGPVTFVVLNAGQHRHDFVLVRAEDDGPAVVRDGHLVDHAATIVGEVGVVNPTGSRSASFTLAPGRYITTCRIKAHDRLGGGLELTIQWARLEFASHTSAFRPTARLHRTRDDAAAPRGRRLGHRTSTSAAIFEPRGRRSSTRQALDSTAGM